MHAQTVVVSGHVYRDKVVYNAVFRLSMHRFVQEIFLV